jgi:hypothetical protein
VYTLHYLHEIECRSEDEEDVHVLHVVIEHPLALPLALSLALPCTALTGRDLHKYTNAHKSNYENTCIITVNNPDFYHYYHYYYHYYYYIISITVNIERHIWIHTLHPS